MTDNVAKLQAEIIELKAALIAAGGLLGNFVDMTDDVLAILKETAVELKDVRPDMADQVNVLAQKWANASDGVKARMEFEQRVAPPASDAAH